MTRNLLLVSTAVAALGVGGSHLFAAQPSETKMAAATRIDEGQKLRDADIIDHESRMRALIAKLETSLQAMVDAKDANGYVRNRSIVKAHEMDIVTLRNAVRNQKLFLIVYEDKCGADSRQHDQIIQLQQQLKATLYDVVDTFDSYQIVNDSSTEASQSVEPSLDLHREALKEAADAITQNEQAMAQLMKKCF